jgi:hypothetical protein
LVIKARDELQLRVGVKDDAGSWDYSSWSTLTNSWNGVEMDSVPGYLTGYLNLSLNGTSVATLNTLTDANLRIDSVRMGAIGVATGTRGTVYFDDYDSRRFSTIGLLPDPGTHTTPIPVAN